MKHNLLLIILLVITISFSFSNVESQVPDTSFVITVVDDTNDTIEIPAFIQVREILDNKLIHSYRLALLENPQTLSESWSVPSRDANTEIHIVAIKQGFENSEEFVFTITDQTPTAGILFEEIFTLNQIESQSVVDATHQVNAFDNSFDIITSTTSTIQSIDFLQDENTISVVLMADELVGFVNVQIPTSLMESPFEAWLDDEVVFADVQKMSLSNKINIDYSNGLHSIRIVSTEVITDPSLLKQEEMEQLHPCKDNEVLKDGKCVSVPINVPIEIIIGGIAAAVAAAVAVFFLTRKKGGRWQVIK